MIVIFSCQTYRDLNIKMSYCFIPYAYLLFILYIYTCVVPITSYVKKIRHTFFSFVYSFDFIMEVL